MSYDLEILNLDDSKEINEYRKLLKNKGIDHPYYSYAFLHHHRIANSLSLVFHFKNESQTLAIMPILIRKVDSGHEELYDAISPYGYSGPLFHKASKEDIKGFWDAVDKWYQENKVVTEFIRFHLNDNEKYYSGQCVPTLNNIYGCLPPTFDEQWNTFLPKVRNNYRKAEKENLVFKLYTGKEISEDIITSFYIVYSETMKRNKASEFLYFSKEHFIKLVFANPEHFSIALVFKEDIAVSSELIIYVGDCIYAYLGGTLSNYFHCRPNDFLRVEIIRWAILKKNKHYILGGGIINDDGLYKFKKSLFPKSEDRIFYTGRKVIDREKYDLLNERTGISKHEDGENHNFFPLYRNTSK